MDLHDVRIRLEGDEALLIRHTRQWNCTLSGASLLTLFVKSISLLGLEVDEVIKASPMLDLVAPCKLLD